MKLTLKSLQAIVEQTMNEIDEKKKRQPAVKQQQVPELSDEYYASLADRFYQDYGRTTIEDSWEEKAVQRFCSSVKATSCIDIDRNKLKKALEKRLEQRDKDNLARKVGYLKEIAHKLRVAGHTEEK